MTDIKAVSASSPYASTWLTPTLDLLPLALSSLGEFHRLYRMMSDKDRRGMKVYTFHFESGTDFCELNFFM